MVRNRGMGASALAAAVPAFEPDLPPPPGHAAGPHAPTVARYRGKARLPQRDPLPAPTGLHQAKGAGRLAPMCPALPLAAGAADTTPAGPLGRCRRPDGREDRGSGAPEPAA